MNDCKFSIVIPAHNEERFIGACLESVVCAAEQMKPDAVEIIVVANRCTDKTIELAEQLGACVLTNDEKCISAIRNTGVRAAHGEIIVTLDADSVMTENALPEVRRMLESGKFIGGGTRAPCCSASSTVLSVHRFATTMISTASGLTCSAARMTDSRHAPMKRSSLWAGITTLNLKSFIMRRPFHGPMRRGGRW